MPDAPFTLLRYLRGLAGTAGPDAESDGGLLARFVAGRDEAAFTSLLHRHGPMVWHVCRRVLGDADDTEDAFQATFLLLASKAAAIRRRESVGGWLYRTAYRIAARARAVRARRQALEHAAPPPAPRENLDLAWRELQAVLDEEVGRLPDRYRAPLLLCYLQGLTHEAAAARLGCPVGTVRSRLARARDRLRARLTRRGLALSATAFAAVVAAGDAPAAVPAGLAEATRCTALVGGAASADVLALARGVCRAVFFPRFVAAALVVLVVGLAGAAFAASLQALKAGRPGATPPADPPKADNPPVPQRKPEAPKPGPVAKERLTLTGHEEMVWAAAYSPDGKTLATASGLYNRPGEIIFWDTVTGKERARAAAEKGIRSLAFSPDGKSLATADYYTNTVKLRDPASGEVRLSIETGRANNAVAFSPDGKTLAVAILDRSAVLYDATTGKELLRFEGHTDWVPHVAFSPDGKTLATGSRDTTARLWDAGGGKELLALKGHTGTIEFVAFSPDGRTLATASWDRTVKLWEVATGKERATLEGHQLQVLSAAFAPDGRTLVTTSGEAKSPIAETNDKPGEIKVWDLKTRKEIASLSGHKYRVWMARFAPDGKELATVAEDRTIKLWDLAGRAAPPRDAADGELERWWEDLAGADAAAAYRAVWSLAGARGAVPFLRQRLRPAAADPEAARRLARLVADLDHDDFRVREKAAEELEKLGAAAGHELRKALEGKPSPEMRRRVERLLDRLSGPTDQPEVLRAVRAVEVLEQVGTPEARRVLEALGKGAAEARLTAEARAALARFAARP
jgi:RNA polymerase sigma factor (sigma-70 family)